MTFEERAAAIEFLLGQRIAQGLPRQIEDPLALDVFATVLRSAALRELDAEPEAAREAEGGRDGP